MRKILFVLLALVSFANAYPPYFSYGGTIYKFSFDGGNGGFSGLGCEARFGCLSQIDSSTFVLPGPDTSKINVLFNASKSFLYDGNQGSVYRWYGNVIRYSLSNDCQSPKIINASGQCVDPAPKCGPNETLDTASNTCKCNGGYSKPITYDPVTKQPTQSSTCEPKKKCPDGMQYFWTDKAVNKITGTPTEYYDCVPRTDLSDDDCAGKGGTPYKWSKDTSDGTGQIDLATLIRT